MAVQNRAAETRQKLVDAAVGLFAANGYLETTPKDIARTADLTTGAFYYHFRSKEELASAIIEEGGRTVAPASAASGLECVVATEFAVIDATNRDAAQWIGFHLGMAIGHLSPAARLAYRERVTSFSEAVSGAVQSDELRDEVTAKQAAELLWVASTGAQLLSDALGEPRPALFDRLAAAWKSALRGIAADDVFPRLEQFVDDTAARYGRAANAAPAPASGRVA